MLLWQAAQDIHDGFVGMGHGTRRGLGSFRWEGAAPPPPNRDIALSTLIENAIAAVAR